REDARTVLLNILADLHPADIADLLERLAPDERPMLFEILDAQTGSRCYWSCIPRSDNHSWSS
ncbi:MAG: hypothetical protein ACE5H0_14760, partial [Bacteroidota bacterium]